MDRRAFLTLGPAVAGAVGVQAAVPAAIDAGRVKVLRPLVPDEPLLHAGFSTERTEEFRITLQVLVDALGLMLVGAYAFGGGNGWARYTLRSATFEYEFIADRDGQYSSWCHRLDGTGSHCIVCVDYPDQWCRQVLAEVLWIEGIEAGRRDRA